MKSMAGDEPVAADLKKYGLDKPDATMISAPAARSDTHHRRPRGTRTPSTRATRRSRRRDDREIRCSNDVKKGG